jgi:RHS repeat-associated protein
LQPHKYTTYERDANGGDEAMHRRYNRWWSRFDQPDPYDGSYDLSDPQSFNRYSYVQNDPVNFVDPSGLIMFNPCGYIGGDGVGVYVPCMDDSSWLQFALNSRFGGFTGGGGGGGGGGGDLLMVTHLNLRAIGYGLAL